MSARQPDPLPWCVCPKQQLPIRCQCPGVHNCSVRAKSGVCKGDDHRKDDPLCDDRSGVRECTLGGARISPGPDLRPKAQAPGTRNAPEVRDHRTRGSAPAVGAAEKPVRRDHRDEAPAS